MQFGSPLYYACYCGLSRSALILVTGGTDVNAQGGNYGNALQAAALIGDEQILKLLLEAGADVNAEGGVYGNALQAAASEGLEEIFRVLMDHGAVVTQNGDFESPWDAARFGADLAWRSYCDRTGLNSH